VTTRRQASWLLSGAAAIVAVFAVAHLDGLREPTSWLCRIDVSTRPSTGELAGLFVYLVSYAGVVFVAPVLALAATLLLVYGRLRERSLGAKSKV
jgi:hypothetical protein